MLAQTGSKQGALQGGLVSDSGQQQAQGGDDEPPEERPVKITRGCEA